MGNIEGWIPWLLLGGALIGGYFLFKRTTITVNPNDQILLHTLISQEFKQIISDQSKGLITQDEANARMNALSQRTVNQAH